MNLSRWKNTIGYTVLMIPIIMLLNKVFAASIYGVNLPYWDDWRDFHTGKIESLSPSHLFKPANDTIYAGGKLLDAIFINFFNGNIYIYNIFSMSILLGGLLALQFALLRLVTRNTLILSTCFLLTIFMLQPDSYWGKQFIAYHQAIPLLLALSVIYLVTLDAVKPSKASPTKNIARIPLIVLLTLFAGFTYTSGAISFLVIAICMFIAPGLTQLNSVKKVRRNALVIGLANTPAFLAQSWVILIYQDGKVHGGRDVWVFPFELEFWVFISGMFSRAMGLTWMPYIVQLIIVILFLAIFMSILITFWREIFFVSKAKFRRQNRNTSAEINTDLSIFLLITIVAIALAYAGQVAAARAGFYTNAVELESLHIRAGTRFHFFWITIALPWLILSIFILSQKYKAQLKGFSFSFALPLIPAILTVGFLGGTHKQSFFFKEQRVKRLADITCIQAKLAKSIPVICKGAYPIPLDKAIKESIANQYLFSDPFVASLDKFDNDTIAGNRVYDKKNETHPIKLRGITMAEFLGTEFFVPDPDPQMIIQVQAEKKCRSFIVDLEMSLQHADQAQFFYSLKDSLGFNEKRSSVVNYVAGTNRAFIEISKKGGILTSLRVDPVKTPQPMKINHFAVNCGT